MTQWKQRTGDFPHHLGPSVPCKEFVLLKHMSFLPTTKAGIWYVYTSISGHSVISIRRDNASQGYNRETFSLPSVLTACWFSLLLSDS